MINTFIIVKNMFLKLERHGGTYRKYYTLKSKT